MLLFGLILLLWLLFELIFCCYLGIFFSWVKWIEFIRIRVFKTYLRVFKILFKGVQHLYNTYIIIIIFPFVFNTWIAHPHLYVEPPLKTLIITILSLLGNTLAKIVYKLANRLIGWRSLKLCVFDNLGCSGQCFVNTRRSINPKGTRNTLLSTCTTIGARLYLI